MDGLPLFLILWIGDNDLPPEAENSDNLWFADVVRNQVIYDQLIVYTFRGTLHATNGAIDCKD